MNRGLDDAINVFLMIHKFEWLRLYTLELCTKRLFHEPLPMPNMRFPSKFRLGEFHYLQTE
jgi:hypothetical protein